jgi:predicted transcriptional regulator of viral defense system
MKFRDFETLIKPLLAFNLNDVRKIDPSFHRQQLTYWLEKGLIRPLVGGYYMLSGQRVNEAYLFMLANKVYEPSYVSLESALAYYQLIPESVLGVTSISARKTQQFDSAWGLFSYRSVKPLLMFGYQVIESEQRIKFKMARFEKAVLDYLYLNSGTNAKQDVEGLRCSKEQLQQLDEELLISYLRIFDNAALKSRVQTLMEYAHA